MQTSPCVVFDVDGTLTCTTGVDDQCLVEAWREVLGVGEVDTDWSHYAHSTDEGLTLEVCTRAHARPPTRREVAHVQDRFFALLTEKITADAARCIPVPGAAAMLEHLLQLGWRIGIASGAWEQSARIKLRAAGLERLTATLPGTFSHAHATALPATREEIVTGTLNKLGRHAGAPAVYIGDGVWDANAAAALNIGFVGMRVDGDESRLRALNVQRIAHNYVDPLAMQSLVQQALHAHAPNPRTGDR